MMAEQGGALGRLLDGGARSIPIRTSVANLGQTMIRHAAPSSTVAAISFGMHEHGHARSPDSVAELPSVGRGALLARRLRRSKSGLDRAADRQCLGAAARVYRNAGRNMGRTTISRLRRSVKPRDKRVFLPQVEFVPPHFPQTRCPGKSPLC